MPILMLIAAAAGAAVAGPTGTAGGISLGGCR